MSFKGLKQSKSNKIKTNLMIIIPTIFLILLNSINTQYQNACPRYECIEEAELSKTTCMSVNESGSVKTYRFQQCEKNYKCDFNPNFNYLPSTGASCNHSVLKESLLPGDKCSEDYQCSSGKCKGRKCKGLKEEEKCTEHKECNVGLFCYDKTNECKKLLNLPSISKDDNKCKTDFECRNNLICYESKCTLPYTLADGENSYMQKMCRSNRLKQVVDNSTIGFKTICDSISLITTSLECSNTQKSCSYKWNHSGDTFDMDCICGLNGDGKRFCPADDRQEFLDERAFDFIAFDTAHTLRRDPLEFGRSRFELQYPNKDVSECLIKAINSKIFEVSFFVLLMSFVVLLM